MLVEREYARGYLFTALEAAPGLFLNLLSDLKPGEADLRPDHARFTIREIMAHVAAWEQVTLERLSTTVQEDNPRLSKFCEQSLIETYRKTDPMAQARIFRERRHQTIAFLCSRCESDWSRTANKPDVGTLTLEAQVLLLPLHDTYHYSQIAAWRAEYETSRR